MSSRNGKKTLDKTANSPTVSPAVSPALDSTKNPQGRSLETTEDQCHALGQNAQESLALEESVEKPCYIKGYN
jgi:hypothetical protein